MSDLEKITQQLQEVLFKYSIASNHLGSNSSMLDGASNTGVDHVRDLTDWLHERPLGKRKIVIIDEVHMLSRQAFNALLKTLEEPPAYALIILCTTEADRIPATIRSRSACYTITQIPEAIICEHLLEVATEFQIRIQPEAAELIASYSGGAMRNALKLLEQLSNGEDEITADVVRSVLGMSEKDELLRIIQAMLSGNYTKLLESLNSIAKSGKSLLSLTEELLNESTSLLLAKTGQPSSSSAIAENYTLERLCELSAKINWLNDELKNAAGSGIAAYIHATKDLNTGESGLAGKLKSLEDQMFRLSAERMEFTIWHFGMMRNDSFFLARRQLGNYLLPNKSPIEEDIR